MSRDDLKLNSLDRFRKSSSRLVLEEHSHCEVPAGCGGAVLRWIHPAEALPLTVRVVAQGTVTLTLDGAALPSARTTVSAGVHVFALEVVHPGGAMVFHAAPDATVPRSRPLRDAFALCSQADGRWRVSARPPPDDLWRYPGFDDAHWTPLRECPLPSEWTGRNAWHVQKITGAGARPLALPFSDTVWVRCRFEVSLAEAP